MLGGDALCREALRDRLKREALPSQFLHAPHDLLLDDVRQQPLTGLVQGGAKNDPAKSFPPIAHEPTTQTGLSHKDGAVSMARYAPGTAGSEFFICVGDLSSLDADPKQSGDNLGFAVFGHVVSGMDVVKAILTAPVSATKGEAEGMKGQMLDPEIAIVSARRV